jgi:hypothetical protein
MALIKGCTTAVLALTVSLFAVGCGDDNEGSRCSSDELYATINSETKCFTKCDTVADCGSTERCSGSPSVCLPASGTGTNNPDPVNNPDPINNPQPTCDGTAVCSDFCTKLYDTCMNGECTGPVRLRVSATVVEDFTIAQISDIFYSLCMDGYDDPNNPANNERGCLVETAGNVQACEAYKSDAALLSNCSAARPFYCGAFDLAGIEEWQNACSCERPGNLATACTTDDGCDGGEALQGSCIPQSGQNEAGETVETGFLGGYCSAYGCEPNQTAQGFGLSLDARCGDSGLCLPAGSTPQNPYGLCLKGCSSVADCPRGLDAGYTCRILFKDDDDSVGMCWPKCDDDDDCSSPAEGNTPAVVGKCSATSYCMASCNPATANSVCIQNGGTCVPTEEDDTKGFCAYD